MSLSPTTPLPSAATPASTSELVAALDASAKILFGAPALHVAASEGYTNVASALMLHGASAGERDAEGRTAGDVAADEATAQVVRDGPARPLPHIVSHRMDACEAYVAKHRLPEIVQELTAQVLFHQPDDVRAFLVDRIRALMAARDGTAPAKDAGLFHDTDLATVFDIFDIHNRGYISLDQYAMAMRDIGATHFDPAPTAAVDGRVDKKAFLFLASAALADTYSAYADASA